MKKLSDIDKISIFLGTFIVILCLDIFIRLCQRTLDADKFDALVREICSRDLKGACR